MEEFLSKIDPNTIITAIFTLFGTILGWLLNNLSRRGKLCIYPTWEDSFLNGDGGGGETKARSVEEAKHYTYKLVLEVYNSSADPKIMRNIQIAFFQCSKGYFSLFYKELFRVTPYGDTIKRSGLARRGEDISP